MIVLKLSSEVKTKMRETEKEGEYTYMKKGVALW